MTDELFDPLPGDGYDEPVDYEGTPLAGFDAGIEVGGTTHRPPDDIGPPAPGEWNEKDYPNPEIGMKC